MMPPLSISMVTMGWLAVAEGSPSLAPGFVSLLALFPAAPLLLPLLLLALLLVGLLPQPAAITITRHNMTIRIADLARVDFTNQSLLFS